MALSPSGWRFGLGLCTLFVLSLTACKEQGQVEKKGAEAVASASGGGKSTGKKKDTQADSEPSKPSAQQARELALTLPSEERIQSVVNPKKLKPYAGPTGAVRGVVTVTGDQAPELPKVVAKMDSNCRGAAAMFGKVFREGDGRTLADVLVAVTEYDGFVPSEGTDVVVPAQDCTYGTRTLTMTYGQRVVIEGKDNRPYVPEILGQPLPAQLFVLPTSPRVAIAPKRPGQFKLVDSMRLFNVVELFVLPYPTTDVTELDGKFEIAGLPVGKAKINAFLPQTGVVVEKEIVIEEGKTLELDLELPFDKAAWDKKPKPLPLDERPAPKTADSSSKP